MQYTLFGAIDIGSSEMELKIFELSRGKGMREIDCIRNRLELGKDTYATGKISTEKLEELCLVLNDFISIMKSYKVDAYRAYTTSAIREAKNRTILLDYLEKKEQYDAMAEKVIYTGAIDAYFDYKLGTLEYRSVRFENETLDKPNFQGNAAVNYTDVETPWTRIIEHKWFEFGKDEEGNDLPKTVISREYSSEWKPGDEPYYPVNDEKNGALYGQYKELAEKEPKVIFGGRLGEYKYYDMDAVIASALDMCERELA